MTQKRNEQVDSAPMESGYEVACDRNSYQLDCIRAHIATSPPESRYIEETHLMEQKVLILFSLRGEYMTTRDDSRYAQH